MDERNLHEDGCVNRGPWMLGCDKRLQFNLKNRKYMYVIN